MPIAQAEDTRRSHALNLNGSRNAETVEIRWSLTPRALRDPQGKRPMRSRIERSSSFRALSPGLRETLRALLSIADAPMVGRTGMVHGFAKVEAIAERRGCSRRQAVRDLARLDALGWIAKARREPVRFNLGLVFTVFDAPIAAPVRLVGAPKGPNARAGLRAVETLSGMASPQATPPMSSPQAETRMSSPNRERQCETQPSQEPAPQAAGLSLGGGGVAHEGTLRTAEPPPAKPADAVREWLSVLRGPNGRGLNPSTIEDLARRPEIASAGLERLQATWRSCQASGLADPLGGLVARLKRGEIADAPKRSAPMRRDSPTIEELAADAVPIEVHRAEMRRIRESVFRRSA